ncbi:MAG: bifunctional tetrahydrofolate synthase/dihydrofolate synthase [Thiohalocapsa sp.]
MRFQSLSDWLRWQETLHPNRIDLRLERVGGLWSRLAPKAFSCPVITVGGTNGKGSCVAYLDSLYRAGGYRVCAFTSPHLLRYNERIRIDGRDVGDAAICESFARIDEARRGEQLTYFEFGTLAALDLFQRAVPDVVILEVGLGGRLDAVNIVDADLSVVTSIGLDHTALLGDDPNQIALEKAGIFRPLRPAVIGQRQPPPRLRQCAADIGADVFQLGREFEHRIDAGQWHWQGPAGARRDALPPPALRGQIQYDNAATALCAVTLLERRLPLANTAVRQGLLRTRLLGRFTVYPGEITWIFDVAHNADAAKVLAANLDSYPCTGVYHAVFALLADKDAGAVTAALSARVDHWHLAPAPSARAMLVEDLYAAVAGVAQEHRIVSYSDVGQAMSGAAAIAKPNDCVLVFGSFMTVEAGLRNPLVASV